MQRRSGPIGSTPRVARPGAFSWALQGLTRNKFDPRIAAAEIVKVRAMTVMFSIDDFKNGVPIERVHAFFADEGNTGIWSASLSAHAGAKPRGLRQRPGFTVRRARPPDLVTAVGWIGPYTGQIVFLMKPAPNDTTVVAAHVKLAPAGISTTGSRPCSDETPRAVVRDLRRVRRELEP